MTDKELLDLAAKAAGVAQVTPMRGQWNPLTDDADAFRLMLRLNLLVDVEESGSVVATNGDTYIRELNANDRCVAARRAITRAAAEIGATK